MSEESLGEPLTRPETQDSGLSEFLDKVKNRFFDSRGLNIESAVPVVLRDMSSEQIDELVGLANGHFTRSLCLRHEPPIVNDEKYIEGVPEDGLDEGPIVDQDITAENLSEFLVTKGSNALRAHLRAQLSKKEWQSLETEEMKRHLADARNRGTLVER